MQISNSFSNVASFKKLNSSAQATPPKRAKGINFKGICPEKIFQPQAVMDKYLNGAVVNNAIVQNPKINEILIQNGVKPCVSLKNIQGASQNHFKTTYDAAMEIANKNGIKGVDLSNLRKGSLLHDIGKSLIPVEIIDKPGKLDIREREIINLHSQLGSEILNTTELPKPVSRIARLHHTPIQDAEKARDELSQIVSVSDVYSALSEKRPYKAPMSFDKIQDIMTHDEKLKQGYVAQLLGIVKDGFFQQ